MTERKKTAAGPGFEFSLFARGKQAAELRLNGTPKFYLGRVTLEEKFSETGSLEKKLRRHESADLLSIGLDSVNILPFGCEYAIARDFEVTDGFAEYSNDISALHYGRVGSLELEPMTFTGKPQSVEFILPDGEKFEKVHLVEEKEIFNGSLPLLLLTVCWADGSRVEYAMGTDVWRHCAARNIPGTRGEFTLYFDGENLTYERKVLIYDAETEPEKRPWRFKNLISWQTDAVPVSQADSTFAVSGCQVNPAARREVRRQVRSGKGALLLTGASPGLCPESSHVERPGRKDCIHFDLAEYVSFRLWANRHLMKSGGTLAIRTAEDNIFNQTVAVQNLRCVPRPLEPNGEEDV